MNRLGRNVAVLAIGLTGLLSSCGLSSSGSSGSMFIESCTLNCSSNGASGGQVSCGVISTHQNQEIGVLFSKPVSFASVSKQSFQVTDSATGTVPSGTFLLDPFDARRVIFRPSLTFDPLGNPVFGFQADTSYSVFIPGTRQGDGGPFIRSTGGSDNGTRLACTITTNLGISDPVAGPPIVAAFVDTVFATGVSANGATDVLLTSKITMVFNDLMNIGTLVIPGTGNSPFITVKLDPDGNVANSNDQVPISGLFTFNLDQVALQTTVVFTPSQPFPSAGANLASPRKVVVNLPSGIKDLIGQSLGNAGPVIFTPRSIHFDPIVVPTGGEQFTSLANCDQDRSGANWGEVTPGRLTPGLGGGSGRLGDLKVQSGEVFTLHTGATNGFGTIQFQPSGPLDGDTVNINGVELFIADSGGVGPPLTFPFVEFEGSFPALTLNNLIGELNASVDPLLTGATYSQEGGDTVRIRFKTPGATGANFTFDVYKIIANVHFPSSSVLAISGPTIPGGTAHMLDGVDSESFAAGNLLDNFDFQANPAGTPNPVVVADGTFEFATVTVENGGTLRFDGPKPARLLVRGKATISGLVDVSGQSRPVHPSDSPQGQPGGFGGPNGGDGGAGADRLDNSGSDLIASSQIEPTRPWDFGVVNPGGFFQGRAGVGIGRVGTIAAGPAGVQWPTGFPAARSAFSLMQTNSSCVSEQVGGAGGGGAYSLDGGIGTAVAVSPVASQGDSNTPPDTAGGDHTNAGLEAPNAPPNKRKLTPEKGFLKGGAGGGGGGGLVAQTQTDSGGSPDPCIDFGASISVFRSHSAGAGGGAGGAIQVQAGRSLILGGGIDASGGDGGSADTNNLAVSATQASPGGAASGGAILMQAKQLFLSAVPNRLSIAGGLGGLGSTGSSGGFGGPGLARVEAATSPIASQVASILDPIDPLDPDSINFLSVGAWVRARATPASFQGAQSCWMRPSGSFFSLQFAPDAVGVPGWDMDLILNFGGPNVTVPYRAPNGILPGGQTYEQFWGQLLDRDLQPGEVGAPLVVRFQGAKLSGAMPNPCNVDVSGPASPLVPGSLTPWVRHPSELNAFAQAPDMIRFVIIFDASKLDFANIVGVTNVHIVALPN